MYIQNNINSNSFGAQAPKKQTYNAMKKYYQSIEDTKNAKLYTRLENQAKEKLHVGKSNKAQQDLLDLSETVGDDSLSGFELVKHFGIQVKNSFVAVKEALIGAYYGIKNI